MTFVPPYVELHTDAASHFILKSKRFIETYLLKFYDSDESEFVF